MADPGGLASALADLAHRSCRWHAARPMNAISGNGAGLARIWRPLLDNFPDLERRDSVFVARTYRGKIMVAARRHYCGAIGQDWLGIPAAGKPAYLRYCKVREIGSDGRTDPSSCR